MNLKYPSAMLKKKKEDNGRRIVASLWRTKRATNLRSKVIVFVVVREAEIKAT